MAEPSVRTSRFAIAGALLAILTAGSAGFFVGRASAPPREPDPPAAVVTPAPIVAEPRKPLERAEIIALAQQAADAFASGVNMPDAVMKAGGRRFNLAIPFGCAGPSETAEGRPMRWQYDAEEQTLRAFVAPKAWQARDWSPDAPDGSARGFWIARPWSSSEICPPKAQAPVPSDTEAITLPGQTLAVAQFLAADTDRSALRDDRPFEIVQKLTPDRMDVRQGLRLRVTGRIDSGRRGGPVRCVQPGGIEQRPICAVAVQMEEVRLELPASGEVLAAWPVDRPG